MALSSNLGFPRFGQNRELKNLLESYWAGNVDAEALLTGARQLRIDHWSIQKSFGIDHIPCNDFSLYDHVLDAAVSFGVVPPRFRNFPEGLSRYFGKSK